MILDPYSLAFNGKTLLCPDSEHELLHNRSIFQVTTSTDGHGSITAAPVSGYSGTTVTLSNTPSTNYTFQNYAVTGANLTGNQFTLTGSDVTARANFVHTPEYTSKNAPNYFMSTRASAWMDSDVGKVKFTETDSALHYDLPFGTTAATQSYYLMPTDDKSATFLENSGLFEGYKVTHMTEYPGYDRYSGKYLNTSAVVNRVVFGVAPWIYLSNTATTRNVSLYMSVNGSPMSSFATFYNVSAGTTMYTLAPGLGYTFPQPITVAKGNRINISVYCPDTAVSASVRGYGDPKWSGTMSGIGG